MNGSLLKDAFGHHVWATVTLIDACLELDAGQLETAVPGTFGSILETLRHTVGADRSYLWVAHRRRAPGGRRGDDGPAGAPRGHDRERTRLGGLPRGRP